MILFAVIFGIVLGALGFGTSSERPFIAGTPRYYGWRRTGCDYRLIIGALQRGRVRGAIGQATPPPTAQSSATRKNQGSTRTSSATLQQSREYKPKLAGTSYSAQ